MAIIGDVEVNIQQTNHLRDMTSERVSLYQLDLRREFDRTKVSQLLAERGLDLEPDVIGFASRKLNEDWLMGSAGVNGLWVSHANRLVVSLSNWVQTVQSIYDMRQVAGIEEQIRRLCLPAHEALDTDLVVRIAGNYYRSGFTVAFEPNGKGCSDLRVEGRGFRFYAEVKRENRLEHSRIKKVRRASASFLSASEEVRNWLMDRQLRIEIWFSRLFPDNSVPGIINELRAHLDSVDLGKEQDLIAVRGSRYVVVPRLHPPFYRGGFHASQIVMTGEPVRCTVENMPVLVCFASEPNIKALTRRLREADGQLQNDATKDSHASGFVVLETSCSQLARNAIEERFPSLSPICLGVVLRSDVSYLTASDVLPAGAAEVLTIAAAP
jgi:hypothetical protein